MKKTLSLILTISIILAASFAANASESAAVEGEPQNLNISTNSYEGLRDLMVKNNGAVIFNPKPKRPLGLCFFTYNYIYPHIVTNILSSIKSSVEKKSSLEALGCINHQIFTLRSKHIMNIETSSAILQKLYQSINNKEWVGNNVLMIRAPFNKMFSKELLDKTELKFIHVDNINEYKNPNNIFACVKHCIISNIFSDESYISPIPSIYNNYLYCPSRFIMTDSVASSFINNNINTFEETNNPEITEAICD